MIDYRQAQQKVALGQMRLGRPPLWLNVKICECWVSRAPRRKQLGFRRAAHATTCPMYDRPTDRVAASMAIGDRTMGERIYGRFPN